MPRLTAGQRTTCLLGFLALLAVYAQTANFTFLAWDDDNSIVNNEHLRDLSARSLQWMFTDTSYTGKYEPISWLCWSLIYRLFGRGPGGFHLSNIVVFLATVYLVFGLIRDLMRSRMGSLDPAHGELLDWGAIFATLFWALHPLRVEVVAWANGFQHLLSTLLLSISTLAYLRFARAIGARGHSMSWYLAALVCFGGSLWAYPISLGFVPVLIVLDYFALGRLPEHTNEWRWSNLRRVVLEKLPFVALTLITLGLSLWGRTHNRFHAQVAFDEFGLAHRGMQVVYTWTCVWWRQWLPLDLSPFYTELISFQPTALRFLGSLALFIALNAFCWRTRHRYPAIMGAWVCHLVLLTPMAGFTEHPHYVSDRYSYIASVPWAVLGGLGLVHLGSQARRVLVGTVGTVWLGALGVASAQQVLIWHDSVTLFSAILDRLGDDPHQRDIHWRLGMAEISEGDDEDALAELSKTLAEYPGFPLVRELRGQVYLRHGAFKLAAEDFRVAVTAGRNAVVLSELADAFSGMQRYEAAERALEAALEVAPGDSAIAVRLAWVRAIGRRTQGGVDGGTGERRKSAGASASTPAYSVP